MPVPEIPPMISRYCHRCGSPIIFSETHEPKLGLANRAHVTCPNCGHEGETSWTSGPLRIVPDREDELTDKVGAGHQERGWMASWRARARHDAQGDIYAHRVSARTERLRRENGRSLSENFQRTNFESYIFADVEPRLFPANCSFQLPSFGMSKSPLRAAIRNPGNWSRAMTTVLHEAAERTWATSPYVAVRIKYNDTGSTKFSDSLMMEQHDGAYQSMFGAGSTADQSIHSFLSNLMHFGPPSFRAMNFDSNRHLHLNVIANASRTCFETPLQSGEPSSWEIRRFDFPVPLAHALAQVGQTKITIGAVGIVAEELEDILPQLTRVIPRSKAIADFERGVSESREKWQREARQRAEEWRRNNESSND